MVAITILGTVGLLVIAVIFIFSPVMKDTQWVIAAIIGFLTVVGGQIIAAKEAGDAKRAVNKLIDKEDQNDIPGR